MLTVGTCRETEVWPSSVRNRRKWATQRSWAPARWHSGFREGTMAIGITFPTIGSTSPLLRVERVHRGWWYFVDYRGTTNAILVASPKQFHAVSLQDALMDALGTSRGPAPRGLRGKAGTRYAPRMLPRALTFLRGRTGWQLVTLRRRLIRLPLRDSPIVCHQHCLQATPFVTTSKGAPQRSIHMQRRSTLPGIGHSWSKSPYIGACE